MAPSRTKALPGGPLKLFDCLASTLQADVDALHGTAATNVSVLLAAGAISKLRNWITFPARVALVDDDGGVAAMLVGATATPVGTVTFTDPRT